MHVVSIYFHFGVVIFFHAHVLLLVSPLFYFGDLITEKSSLEVTISKLLREEKINFYDSNTKYTLQYEYMYLK